MDVLKLSVMAICAVISGMILSSAKSPLVVVLTLSVSITVLFYVVSELMQLMTQLEMLKSYITSGGKYIELLIKVMGITYITQLSSDICKDNGYQAVAGQIEIFSKLTIALMSMPVIMALFEMVAKCMG